MVIGVSTGSLLFSNNLVGNLGLINTRLDVHCPNGEERGKGEYPLKEVLLSLRYARDSRTTDSTWHERTESTSFAGRFLRLDPPLFLPLKP